MALILAVAVVGVTGVDADASDGSSSTVTVSLRTFHEDVTLTDVEVVLYDADNNVIEATYTVENLESDDGYRESVRTYTVTKTVSKVVANPTASYSGTFEYPDSEGSVVLWISKYSAGEGENTLTHTDSSGVVSTISYSLISDSGSQYQIDETSTDSGSTDIVFSNVILYSDETATTELNITQIAGGRNGTTPYLANLKSVVIPSNIEKVGSYAFAYSPVKSVALYSDVEFGSYAFYYCTNMESVTGEITNLSEYMFQRCTSLVSVSLSENITEIPKYAFANCNSLADFDFTNIISVGDYAFSTCSLGTIDFTSIESVGEYAFQSCKSLNVTGIINVLNRGVFYNCSSITSVTLSESISEIPAGAFLYCSSLADFDFTNITTINLTAFSGTSLSSVDLTNVKSIDESAFSGCTSLTKVTGWSLTSMSARVFNGCTNLSEIGFADGFGWEDIYEFGTDCIEGTGIDLSNETLYVSKYLGNKSIEIGTLVIKDGSVLYQDIKIQSGVIGTLILGDNCTTTSASTSSPNTSRSPFYQTTIQNLVIAGSSVPTHAFSTAANGNSVHNVTILNESVSIGASAFYNCSLLVYVDFTKVVSIGQYAFRDCKGLVGNTEDSILDLSSVESLGSSAFRGCTGLTEVKIKEGIAVPSNCFYNCTNLTTVYNLDKATSIGGSAFYNCGLTGTVDLSSADSIGNNAFRYCSNISLVITKEGATIGNNAYDLSLDATNATTLVVGTDAYGNEVNGYFTGDSDSGYKLASVDDGLVYLDLSSINVISITPSLFKGSAIEVAILPDSLTSIESSLFYNSYNLKQVVLGSYVTSIGNNAFRSCTSLVQIGVSGSDNQLPDTLASIGSNAFYGCTGLEWIGLPEGLETVDQYAFYGCSNLDFSLPSTVTSIGWLSFSGTAVKTLTIPAGVTFVYQSQFADCTSLTEVTIGESDIALPDYIFQGCTNLTIINNISNISSIGKGSFSGTGFVELEFTSAVTIGESAFSNCASLTKVTFSAGATVGKEAFLYCENLEDVVFSGASTIGEGAFAQCISLGWQEGQTDDDERHWLTLTGVTSIGSGAFKDCASLAVIELPSTLTTLAVDAFTGCTSVVAVTVADGNGTFTADDDGTVYSDSGTNIAMFNPSSTSVVIGADVETISGFETNDGRYESGGVSAISVLTLLESIEVSEGNGVFSSIGGMLTIDNDVVAVPVRLTSDGVIELEGISGIRGCAFYGTNIVSITVSGGCTVYEDAFYGCTSLKSVVIGDGTGDVIFDMDSFGTTATKNADTSYSSVFTSWPVIDSLVLDGTTVTVTGNTSQVRDVAIYAQTELSMGDTSNMFNSEYGTAYLETLVLYSEGSLEYTGTQNLINGSSNLKEVTVAASIASFSHSITTADVTYYIGVVSGLKIGDLGSSTQIYVTSDANIVDWDGTPAGYVYIDREHGVVHAVAGTDNVFLLSEIDGITVDISSGSFTVSSDDGYTYGDIAVVVETIGGGLETVYCTDGSYPFAFESGSAYLLLISESEEGAVWHEVSFDTGCSTVVASVRISDGHSLLLSMLPEPSRQGYVFQGWYADSSCTQLYSDLEDADRIITADITLYALWEYLGDYVDVDSSAGVFTCDGETYTGAEYSEGTIELDYTPNAGYTLEGFEIDGAADISIDGATVSISSVDGYVLVTPVVKYVSSSTDLEYVVEQPTPTADDTIVLLWDFEGGAVSQSGMTWSGMPSVPLIVDDYVYVQVNDTVVKLDIDTGETVASVVTGASTTAFYHYLGYGGGYILDYTSMNVYTEDLEYVCSIPSGLQYLVWYEGCFYGITGDFTGATAGQIYQVSPDSLDENGTMVNLWEGKTAEANPLQYLYGTTAHAVMDGSVMYYISTDMDMDRIWINALDLETGEYSCRQLSSIYSYYLDDGWLTLYNGYLYITAYTTGLFGTYSVDGYALIGYMKVDGTTIGDMEIVQLPYKSLTSAFVIQNGRGYVNVTESGNSGRGYLCVYDIGENGEPVYVTQVESTTSHGSIVASTYYYDESTQTGEVYIYLLNYSSSQYLYVFTDVCESGVWTFSDSVSKKPIESGFGSQAVRVGTSGQLVFYNDSGKIYCYVSSDYASTYRFLVNDDSLYVASGDGTADDPYEAFEDAAADAFRVTKAAYDEEAGTLTVYGKTYYVYHYTDDGIFASVAGLGSDDFSSIRSFYLTLVSDGNDIDPDELWYGTSGTDEGVGSSGGLAIGDVRLEMTTENAGGTSSYTLALTNDTDQTPTWSSSDSDVAYVDSSGKVAARSIGEATITASVTVDGKVYSVSCVVYVTATTTGDAFDGIAYVQNTALGTPRYEVVVEDGEYDDSAGAYSDATYYIDQDGTITLPSYQLTTEGYEFMGWTDGEAVYGCGTDYTAAGAARLDAVWLTAYGTGITLDANGTEQIALTAGGADVAALAGFSSSDESVVSVDGNGVIAALSEGVATITVEAGGVSYEIEVTVNGVRSIEISESSSSMLVGDTLALEVATDPEGVSATWTSSNTAVATVDEDGIVTAVGAGIAVITATAADGSGAYATCTVTVSGVAAESISISSSTMSLEVGKTGTLTAALSPSDATDRTIVWTSSDTSVATVSNGVVTAVGAGTATITASTANGSVKATCVVTVSSIPADSISLSSSTMALNVGERGTLTATISPSDATDRSVTWTTSDSGVVTVSNGRVTAVGAGTATVTASTADGRTATCTVTVEGEAVSSGSDDSGDSDSTLMYVAAAAVVVVAVVGVGAVILIRRP